ncbi:MAG TPA: hemerythrin family protein [Geothrix sp.]|nr:hemerythrin family protein [Geothrix sp.]
MNTPGLDRRKHKHFRILYLDFDTFWKRFILREKNPRASPATQRPPAPQALPPVQEHHGNPTSSGSRKLDEHHHHLRSDILGFQKELRNGLVEQPLAERLDLLLQKMNDHFHFEESYLSHIGCPDLESRRADHEQFRTALLQLRERAVAGDHTVSLECSSFLFNWLSDHTFPEDTPTEKHLPSH